ncbi:dienelactone hydrolase family protein [Pseudoalteromonas tunicata]|uniref:dienelactone hydrolase family protein n=1 Tax=Pseudoalteromonas tunicata TaxID=314281 RepID=UPI00351138E7
MQVRSEIISIQTETGPMRTVQFSPVGLDSVATIIFYSEIFQLTAPIMRSAQVLAGHGFNVLVPEIFHEFNPAGTVLEYDEAGKDKGNADKWQKPLTSYDSDVAALINYCHNSGTSSGGIGVMGVCIGGHLACRAALNPAIKAAFCLYATDIHSDTLPADPKEQTFARLDEIAGEIHFIWGKQDPHVPRDGRLKLYQKLNQSAIDYQWLEVNAEHAFMRDEGERYDPALALEMYQKAVALFHRTLR